MADEVAITRSAAVSRAAAARRAHDRALQMLARLSEPGALLALSTAVAMADLPRVRPLLERHADACCEEHVAAMGDLARHLSRPDGAVVAP